MDEQGSTPEEHHDRYIPRPLLRFLPATPSVRDALMMSVGMALSTALGIVAIFLVHEWVGVAIAAIGIAHFGVRYRFRILDRYNARKRKALKN